ncbi:NUDIX hydrolase [Shimia thalassica]|uniref:NUDIX hydrolase n=1 Tax=Shimia thalassica TaxID=1715693 RepID=UPI000C08BD9D|nr:NUDIX hydrolase [Shimia thalassica]MDO6800606.1 NUDIX hydrolase [Shimia thalassica]PHO02822.1 NUDIX hydrolase [Rhodobacteraceae bacterium 4F10]
MERRVMQFIDGIGQFAPKTERDRSEWAKLSAFVAQEPKAFDRDPKTSHVTGSAFVLSADRNSVLLTHHAKLDRWLQLGGHCDGISDARFVAQKEAYEESGLSRISLVSPDVFDVDIHHIPETPKECAHLHYDVRFLFQAEAGALAVSEESHALAWVPLDALEHYTDARSVLVVRDKIRQG